LLHGSGVVIGHGRMPLLPPLHLHVHAREVWGVIGPNGAGKTTLVRTLLGLHRELEGRVERSPSVGYVPQRSDLDPNVPGRVKDLVRTGCERRWSVLVPFWERRQAGAVQRALDDCDLGELSERQFRELSEGQKQRALVARALAADPTLLVLDEPTSAMDLHAERDLFALLRRLADKRGLGVVVVSHQLHQVLQAASHLLFVDRDQQALVAGPQAEVVGYAAFVQRYGRVAGSAS
jgi:zinc transport system ATP-binding protein